MSAFTGQLFDGETLAGQAVNLVADGERLQITGPELALEYALAQVRFSDRLGQVPRFVYLPDRRTVETHDNAAVDDLLAARQRGRLAGVIHWLEQRSRIAAVATVLLAGSVAATAYFGLPVLARRAAQAVPDTIDRRAGQTALATFNRFVGPTQLNERSRLRARRQLEKLAQASHLPAVPRLEFRWMGGKYPNAFALPGNIIVVSDEMIQLATDDELAAVFAHELSHLQHRHALQTVFRGSAALLVVSTVTGDLSTLTTFSGTIPFILLQRGFSREFETEADDGAVAFLKRAGIDTAGFVSILEKLEASQAGLGQDYSYLSTHPSTADRIARLRKTVNPKPLRATPPKADATLEHPSTPEASAAAPKAREIASIERIDDAMTPPRVISTVPLEYPAEMKEKGIEGEVTLEFIVDENGKVVSPHVVRSTRREFESTALASIIKWRFAPVTKNGRAVASRAQQVIAFSLQSEVESSDDE